MQNKRVIVLLMDSLGIGASLDAPSYGDAGANTFAHIWQACQDGLADDPQDSNRRGPLFIPNLEKAGFYQAVLASSGYPFPNQDALPEPLGYYGYAVEQSLGKDTPSGHWEIAGVPVKFAWGYFPDTPACFPKKLMADLIEKANLPGVLGQCHASGTDIIQQLGEVHVQTGQPIIYTSADSVFQIAAHETHFGLERLYELCELARTLVDEYHVGRVIARPFLGESAEHFYRTGNRRDYSTKPPELTLLDRLKAAGREVVAIGKTADIFAHQGITQMIRAEGNQALWDATIESIQTLPAGGLIFTNFVDFDSYYGHRRDLIGYAKALEAFDQQLPKLQAVLQEGDVIVITADHGCDPTFPGSDHTREHVPVLVFGPNTQSCFIGRRDSFADIGQSLAEYLKIPPLNNGVSFI